VEKKTKLFEVTCISCGIIPEFRKVSDSKSEKESGLAGLAA
jgi:hypothetical protein